MAIVIDRRTKQIETLDTVTAFALADRYVVYHKTKPPQDVYDCPPQYRVIDGDAVRVATAEERQQIDAAVEADQQAAAEARRAAAKERAKRLIDGDYSGLSDELLAIYYATVAQSKAAYAGITDLSARTNRPTKTWDETKAAAKALIDAS